MVHYSAMLVISSKCDRLLCRPARPLQRATRCHCHSPRCRARPRPRPPCFPWCVLPADGPVLHLLRGHSLTLSTWLALHHKSRPSYVMLRAHALASQVGKRQPSFGDYRPESLAVLACNFLAVSKALCKSSHTAPSDKHEVNVPAGWRQHRGRPAG